MKKILLIVLIVFLLLFSLNINKGYQFKIELKTLYLSPVDIDKSIAINIEKELLKIKEIKELSLLSSEFGCNLYIKLQPFEFNRIKVLTKIKNKIDSFKEAHREILQINYIDNYDLNYQYLLIITSNNDYFKLKQNADYIEDRLLNLKIVNDIKKFGIQQKANYIYFSSNDLIKYNISLEEIKNLIKNQNQVKSFVLKNEFDNYYPINIKNNIKSINDIKKIVINFKDKNFTTFFDNIFIIKEEIKTPSENKVVYNNNDAIAFLISKRYPYPLVFLKFFFQHEKEYKINIFKINKYEKIDLYFNSNAYIQEVMDIDKDNIYFFSKSPHNKYGFDEMVKNRLTIYTKNPKNIIKHLEKNNLLLPVKNLQFNYSINGFKMNEYNITQTELLNSILAQNEGLICDYYYKNDERIEIVLKNKNADNFIYSKKYKILIDLNSLIDTELKNEYILILRKNREIHPVEFKNPSL